MLKANWHGCEQCIDRNKFEGWIKAKKIKDLMITQQLQNDGYTVLRFWEHEIKRDDGMCIFKILSFAGGVLRV